MQVSRFLTAASLIMALALPGTAAAQAKIVFSIHGGPATGKDAGGNGSELAVEITYGSDEASTVKVQPKKGTASKGVASMLTFALKAKGFKATQDGDLVAVEEGPDGKGLREGSIDNTDTGLAENIGIFKGPGAFWSVKTSGCTIPKLKDGMRARARGTILIDVEYQRGKSRVPVRIKVPVHRGESSRTIDRRTRALLEQHGLLVNDVQVDPVLGSKPVDSFGLDRTRGGDPVHHVVYIPRVDPDMVQATLSAGRTPLSGATDYGTGHAGPLGKAPWIRAAQAPRIGRSFAVVVETGTGNLPAGLLVSPKRAGLPLPFLGHGAMLLVDPAGAILMPGRTDAAGRLAVGVHAPAKSGLVGVSLHWQAGFLAVARGVALSNGLTTVIGR